MEGVIAVYGVGAFRLTPSRLLARRSIRALPILVVSDHINTCVRCNRNLSLSLVRFVPLENTGSITGPMTLFFHLVPTAHPPYSHRPQTSSPCRPSSNLSADRPALDFPCHQRSAAGHGFTTRNCKPKWFKHRACLSFGDDDCSQPR